MTNQLILINQTEIQKMNNLEDYAISFIEYLDSTTKTIESYRKNLKQFFIYLREMQIYNPKREDLIQYRKHLENAGYKATTIQAYINTIKQFFKWTAYQNYYDDIASDIKNEKVKNIHRKDSLSKAQFKELINLYIGKEDIESLRNLSIILLEGVCGLRGIEVERSNIEDLKNIAGTSVLMIQGKGQQEKNDFVKLPEFVEKTIRKYISLRESKKPSEALFVSLSDRNFNERLTTRSLSRIVKESMKEIGLDDERLTAHSLRHSTAMTLISCGATIQEVQSTLRHADIRTTMIYLDEMNKLESNSTNKIMNAYFE